MNNWKTAGTVIGIILVIVLLRGCVVTSYLIPSSGMENSLFQGERILVNKWSYGLRLPFMSLWNYHRWGDSPVQKEDIIVFNNPANLSESAIDRREVFISRCIGVPGDTLLIDSLVFRHSIGKECTRPEVPVRLSPGEREATRFITRSPIHTKQSSDGTGQYQKCTQFQPL